MTGRLHGHHAVVTGAGRGVGAAIASALAGEGAAVTAMGRTAAVICDVTNPQSVARAFAAAVDGLGPVHILINNAGHVDAAPLGRTSLESWDRTLAVNLTGTFLCIQQVLPAMLAADRGRIVNVSSTAGLRGYSQIAAYCAAKHGVVGLTRALAAETSRTGVTVNAICPGYIEGTPMLEAAIANVVNATGKSIDDARATLARRSPGGRLATLQEVADAVIRLCLPEAAGQTGDAVIVGGEFMP